MQFQHGTVTMNPDLSLSFEPFKVDGRQLQSNPCTSKNGQFSRYNQTETMTVSVLRITYNTRRSADLNGAEMASLHRPLYENDTARPLRIRRHANEPHVPSLQPSRHASHTDHEPYTVRNRECDWRLEEERLGGFRQRAGPHSAEQGLAYSCHPSALASYAQSRPERGLVDRSSNDCFWWDCVLLIESEHGVIWWMICTFEKDK